MGSSHLLPLDGAKAAQMSSLERPVEAINEAVNGFSGHCLTSSNGRLSLPRRQLFICVI